MSKQSAPIQIQRKLVRLGNIPVEVPITYEARGFDSGKKVRFFRDPLTWMVALVKYRFSALHIHPEDAPVRLQPATGGNIKLATLRPRPSGAVRIDGDGNGQAGEQREGPESESVTAAP